MGKSLDRAGLADLVRDLNQRSETGTLIIRSHDGHAIMIVFEKGQVISLSHTSHRGLDALPEILEFSKGSYSFNPAILGHHQDNLPSAEEISEALMQTQAAGGSTSSAAQPQSGSLSESTPPPFLRDMDAFVEKIQEILAEHVGPIASLLCESTLSESGDISGEADVKKFLAHLAQDISDQADRKRFLSQAAGIIKQQIESG